MSTFYAQYPAVSGGTTTNPSVGVNGVVAPTSSTEVAGINNSGNLQPLQTDASGNLLVSLAAEPLTPLNTKDAADGTPGAANPAVAIQVAGSDGTDLRTLSTTASGVLNTIAAQSTAANLLAQVSQPTASALNATVVQGTAANLLSQVSQPTASALNATVVQGTASNLLSQVSQPTAANLNATVVQSTGSNLHVNVDNFPATQPVSGTVTVQQATPANLQATVTPAAATSFTVAQATASNLNATVVQGTAANLLAQVSQPTASSLNATVVQSTAANLNATVAIAAAQTLATVTTVGAVTAITNALPAGTNVIGATSQAGTPQANAPVYNDYSSINVTTSAYVQLVASLSNAVNAVEIFDSSGQGLIFAVGGIGSEVDQFFIFPGGNGRVPFKIAASARVSIKAKTATANSGYIMVNFYE